MSARWMELVTRSFEQKRQYKRDRVRIDRLPDPYRAVAKAVWRYFIYYPGITDDDDTLRMSGDFADLWERAAADGTPVRWVVGENPVEFAETFAQTYVRTPSTDRERVRLVRTIEEADAQ
jgi:DNA-binding ferritin-like protein (Dps family)